MILNISNNDQIEVVGPTFLIALYIGLVDESRFNSIEKALLFAVKFFKNFLFIMQKKTDGVSK